MASYPAQSLFPGFFRRIIAAVIDFILIALVWFGLGLGIDFLPIPGVNSITFVALDLSKVFIVFLAFIGYFTLLEALFGWTLGKLIFQQEVVTVRGRRPTLVQALIRTLFKPLDMLLLLSPLLMSPKNQTLGDRYARTLVINRDAGVPGIIVEDRYIFSFKKIIGILLLLLSLAGLGGGFYFVKTYLPEIRSVNQAAHAHFMRLEKGKQLKNNYQAAYENASRQVREQETLEEYQQKLEGNPVLDLVLEKRNNIKFNKWIFQGKNERAAAVVYGQLENIYDLEIKLAKEENQWKFVSGQFILIGP
ncbi:RDD family protein [Laspinema olomoucense]|uniref:RDD family protein n=1 Tax=Laspinema olomoucense TaxID=3231600 RepID=UPI0021BA47E7|nr:RDD family protein [Laspinema sp. D3c]MCT7996139.1 RDD family protein [Laspinema sp. D3c]